MRNAELKGRVVRIATLPLSFRIPQSAFRITEWGRARDEGRSYGRHRRPPQRRQIDPVQPLHRATGGDRGRPPGRDTRPELRRGRLERAAVLASGYGRSRPGGRGFPESRGAAPGRAGGDRKSVV